MDPPKRASNPPDFLVKLLTMVTEEAASLLQWSGGKLFIHDPLLLERRLSTYFRCVPSVPELRATRARCAGRISEIKFYP